MLEDRRMLAVEVVSDQQEYLPEQPVVLQVSGVNASETVEFQVRRLDRQAEGDPATYEPWRIADGSQFDPSSGGDADDGRSVDDDGAINGAVKTTWAIGEGESPGGTYEVTATALDSGEVATWQFSAATPGAVEHPVSVTTDKDDYQPSETAIITATGYKLGESVQFHVLHIDDVPNTGEGHDPWVVTDGGSGDLDGAVDGNIRTTWFVSPDDSLGSSFGLTATGLASGYIAEAYFTDALTTLLYEDFNSGSFNTSNWSYIDAVLDYDRYWIDQGPHASSGDYLAELDGNDQELRSRTFDLRNYVSGKLTYQVQHTGHENAPESWDHLHVQYKNSAGKWIDLRKETTSNTGSRTQTSRSITLPSGAFHKNFQFRFNAYDSDTFSSGRGADDWFIDVPHLSAQLNRKPSVSASSQYGSSNKTIYDNENSNHWFTWSSSDADGNITTDYARVQRSSSSSGPWTTLRTDNSPGGKTYQYVSDGLGYFTMYAYAKDAKGSAASARSKWIRIADDDTAGPTLGLTGGGAQTDGDRQLFTWDIKDAKSGVASRTVTVTDSDGVELYKTTTDNQGNFDFEDLGPGTYTLTATATDGDNDRTGDAASTSSSVIATLTDDDTKAPAITITGSQGEESAEAQQRFTWYVSDDSNSTSQVVITKNGTPILTRNYSEDVDQDTFDFNSFGLGTYVITVTATDQDTDRPGDQLSSTATRTVNVVYPTPVADLVVTTAAELRKEGSEIAFDASGSYDPNGGAISFLWDFGDGTSSTDLRPVHTYADSGSYTVTLTVQDPYGGEGVASSTIQLANVAPTATWAGTTTVDEGGSATLSLVDAADAASADASAGFRYAFDIDANGTWDSGDGTWDGSPASSEMTVPASRLPSLGNYSLKGRVLDKDGGFTDYVQTITVADDDPDAPAIVLTGRTGVTADAPGSFGWSVTDASGLSQLSIVVTQDVGDGPVVLLDTESLSSAEGEFDLNSYGLGEFEIQVTATDADADRDGDQLSSSATRTVRVVEAGPNTAPTAVGSTATLLSNGSTPVELSGTDAESPLELLTFTIDSLPTAGDLIAPDGSVVQVGDQFLGSPTTLTYRVRFSSSGLADQFNYSVTDSGNPSITVSNAMTSAPATVNVNAPSLFSGAVLWGGSSGSDAFVVSEDEENSTLTFSNNGSESGSGIQSGGISGVYVFGNEGNDSLTFGDIGTNINFDGGTGFDSVSLDAGSFEGLTGSLGGISFGGDSGFTGAFSGLGGIDIKIDVFGVKAKVEDGVLNVSGNFNNDDIRLRQLVPQGSSDSTVEVYDGDKFIGAFLADDIASIVVKGGLGNDSVDLAYDPQAVVNIPAELIGGEGDDSLRGGLGNDTLRGGLGLNQLDGGGGENTLYDQDKAVLRHTLLVVVHGFETYRGEALNGGGDAGDGAWSQNYAKRIATTLEAAGTPTTTMLVDWNSTTGSNTDASQRVADEVLRFVNAQNEVWDVFFIGHSRGGIFVREVGNKLGESANLGQIRQIMLDPTAANLMHDRSGNVSDRVEATTYDDEKVLAPFGVSDGITVNRGGEYVAIADEMRDDPTGGLIAFEDSFKVAGVFGTGVDTLVFGLFGGGFYGYIIDAVKAVAEGVMYHVEITPWYLEKSDFFPSDVADFVAGKDSANVFATRATPLDNWVHNEHYTIFNAGQAKYDTDWRDVLTAVINHGRYYDSLGLTLVQNYVDTIIGLLGYMAVPDENDDYGERGVKENLRKALDGMQRTSDFAFTVARHLGDYAKDIVGRAMIRSIDFILDGLQQASRDLDKSFGDTFADLEEDTRNALQNAVKQALGPFVTLFPRLDVIIDDNGVRLEGDLKSEFLPASVAVTGTINTDGSISVSGESRIPAVNGLIELTGTVTQHGKYSLSGSLAGSSISLGAFTSGTVNLSNSGITVAGIAGLPVLGSVSLSGTITSHAKYSLTAKNVPATIKGFRFPSLSVTLSNAGLEVSGSSNLPVIGSTNLSGKITSAAKYSLSIKNVSRSIGGYSFPSLDITLSNSGLSLAGSSSLPLVGSVNLKGSLTSKGSYSLSVKNVSRPIKGFSFPSLTVTLSNSGVSLSGKSSLPVIGSVSFSGKVYGSNNYSLTGKATGRKIRGFSFPTLAVTLSNSGLKVSGSSSIPAIGSVSFQGSITSYNNYVLTGSINGRKIGGYSTPSGSITLKPSGLRVSGKMDAPVIGRISISGSITSTGRFYLTASNETKSFKGFKFPSLSVTVSNSGIRVSGNSSIPVLGSQRFYGSIKSNGSFDLYVRLRNDIAGVDLAKIRLNNSGLTVSAWAPIFGNVTLSISGSRLKFSPNINLGVFKVKSIYLYSSGKFRVTAWAAAIGNFSVTGPDLSKLKSLLTDRLPKVKIDGPRVGGTAGQAGLAISNAAKNPSKIFNGTTAGAMIFFDANFNGVLDDLTDDPDDGGYAEPWTFTSHLGQFLPEVPATFDRNDNGILDDVDGQWVVLGGQYTATGVDAQTVSMTPGSWSMITPVTTLIAALSNGDSFTVPEAAVRVRNAFGLPDVDLATFDPIPEMQNGNADGAKLYVTHAMLTNTAAQMMTLFPLSETLTGHEISRAMTQEIVDQLGSSSIEYDLADGSVVDALIRGVATRIGVEIADELIVGASTVIANINARLGAIDAELGVVVMNDVEPIKLVAQRDAVAALRDAVSGAREIADVVADFTGDSLSSRILAVVLPPTLLVPEALVVEATSANGATADLLVTATDIAGQLLPTTLSHASGSLFPLGETTVTATATNAAGDTATKTFTVTVLDTTAPTLTVSETLTFEAAGPEGVPVAVLNSAVADAVDPNPTLTLDLQGDHLPLGITTITATVADSSGNTDTFEFDVVVEDTVAPQLTVPEDIIVEATGPDGAEVSLPESTASDAVDPNPIVAYDQSSGLLPLGTTVVEVTAVDGSENLRQSSFQVTVRDTTAPEIILPDELTFEATETGGTPASALQITATDIVDEGPTVVLDTDFFSLGDNLVTATATDAAGNSSSRQFTVKVLDTIAPEINIPLDVVFEADRPGGALVQLSGEAQDIADASPTLEFQPASAVLPIGTSLVNAVATDASGNSSEVTVRVFVRDTTAPDFVDLPNIIAYKNVATGALITFPEASVADLADPDPQVTYDTEDGFFPVGVTTVSATVSDEAGNSRTSTFTVTIVDSQSNFAAVPLITSITEPPEEGREIAVTAEVFSALTQRPYHAESLEFRYEVFRKGESFASGSGLNLKEFHFTPEDNGTYDVTLTVVNAAGVSREVSQSVKVRNVAPTPQITSISTDRTEGTRIDVTATATDPAGEKDSLKYTLQVLKDGASFTTVKDVEEPVFSFTPDDNATYEILVTATDEDGASGQASETIVVENKPPTAEIVAISAVRLEGTEVVVTGGSVDAAGTQDKLTFSYTVYKDENETPFAEAADVDLTTFRFTPDDNGSYEVVLTVSDEDGGATSVTQVIDIANVAPSVAATADKLTVDEGKTAKNQGTYADPGADTVTVTASIGTLTDNGDGTWKWSWDTTDGPDDSRKVTITATDSDGDHTSTTFDLVVENVAPSVAAAAATVTVKEGETAKNTGTLADPGADTVTLSASVGTVTDNGDGTWKWSWSTSDGPDDSQKVTITATDSDGDHTSTTFDLVVENVAPSVAATAANVTVNEGDTAKNQGTYSDPGVDSVTLTASVGTVTDNGDGTWKWSWDTSDGPDDSQKVTITATDSDGDHTSTTFDLVVDNVAPSVAAAAANVTVNEGDTAKNQGTYFDPGADSVALTASVGTVTDNGDGTWKWSWNTTDGPDDSQVVTITATDSDGDHTKTTFQLVVDNVAPSVAASASTFTADEGSTAVATGTHADPGADSITLAASIGTVIDNGQGTWTWSWGTSDGPDDSQTVTITATDSDGDATSTTFSLVVDNVAPTVVANAAKVNVDEGDTAKNQGTYADPGVDSVALSASVGTVTDNGDGTWKWSWDTSDGPDDSQTVTIKATDSDGDSTSTTFSLAVDNVAPTVVANADKVTVEESDTASNQGTFSDPGVDSVALTASIGTVTDNGDGSWKWSWDTSDGPDDSQKVTITATDSDGAATSVDFDLTVRNVAPSVTSVATSAETVESASTNGTVTVDGTFVDPGVDTHTVTVDWGDGTVETVAVDQQADTFVGSHDYADGGIYVVTVTAKDSDGAVSAVLQTQSIVQGVGLVDGTLYVIGTANRDHVDLKFDRKKDELKVDAKLLQGGDKDERKDLKPEFVLSDVDRIVAFLSDGDDHFHGDDKQDAGESQPAIPLWIFAGAGDDHIWGGEGDDFISGGAGKDKIDGGDGRDILIGGTGKDKLKGGDGNDLLIGGSVERQDDITSVDDALTHWTAGDLAAVLVDLGTITDDREKDDLKGEKGIDHLIGGLDDKEKE